MAVNHHRLTYRNAFSVPSVDFVFLARGLNPGRRLRGETVIDRPCTHPTTVPTSPDQFVKDHQPRATVARGDVHRPRTDPTTVTTTPKDFVKRHYQAPTEDGPGAWTMPIPAWG